MSLTFREVGYGGKLKFKDPGCGAKKPLQKKSPGMKKIKDRRKEVAAHGGKEQCQEVKNEARGPKESPRSLDPKVAEKAVRYRRRERTKKRATKKQAQIGNMTDLKKIPPKGLRGVLRQKTPHPEKAQEGDAVGAERLNKRSAIAERRSPEGSGVFRGTKSREKGRVLDLKGKQSRGNENPL